MDGRNPPENPRVENGVEIASPMELLAVMGRDFVSTRDLDATLARALACIARYVEAEAGALFLLEEAGQTLRCHASVGPTEIRGLTLKADQGIVGRSVQTNVGEIVRDVSEDPNFTRVIDEQTGFCTRSILCAPMSVKDERIGAIELVNKRCGSGLFDHADLTLLQALASSAALAILNARMAAELVEQERVRRELELAAEIQRSLLPEPPADDFPIHGVNCPARTVSGDFFDFFMLPDGRICFSLGDVSGKGINAALLMAKAASLFRCLGKTVHEPGHLLSLINAEISETVTRGMFITMVAGVYDPSSGSVRIANAGHEPPLFHDRHGAFTAFEAEAPPIGITPPGMFGDAGFPETRLHLDGGAFYIFTDGVTEGYLADGSELGVAGLKRLMDDNAGLPATERLTAVTRRIARADAALRDDLTLLVIDDAAAVAMRAGAAGRTPPAGPTADVGERLLDLRFPAKPERLKLVRGAVSAMARLNGCSEGVARDIVIAVDEACQNVIRHAYQGASDEDIILEVYRRGADLVFLLKDFAPTIDTAKVKPRDLDEIRPGGLGTHLIREIMDEAAFLSPPPHGGNVLKMVKRIA
jgi:sigma-B regulation protein RsbU (phosphoserine phosphatase)